MSVSRSLLASLLLPLIAQPALAQALSAQGEDLSSTAWRCDVNGTGIGSLVMHGTTYDLVGLDRAVVGEGAYRKGLENIAISSGPLLDDYGIRSGVYGPKAATETMIFYGTEKRKLTCHGTKAE